MPARLQAHPIDAPQPAHAPHCRDAVRLLRHLGLPPTTRWVWTHWGPIGASTTPLRLHGSGLLPPSRRIIGGGGQTCDVATAAQLRPFAGLWLDRFLVLDPPDAALRLSAGRGPRLRGGRSWVVYAAACGDPDGIWVDWEAGEDEYVHRGLKGRRSTSEDLALFRRLEDLLVGGRPRRGRPVGLADPAHGLLAEQAEAIKRSQPGLSWEAVAKKVGAGARTLQRYREERDRDLDRRGQRRSSTADLLDVGTVDLEARP